MSPPVGCKRKAAAWTGYGGHPLRLARLTCLTLTGAVLLAAPLGADEQSGGITGRKVMERVDGRDDGDNQVQDMQMVLIDKNGNERVREMRALRRDLGEDTQSILFFLSPADVRETGFLTYDYDGVDKDD